MRGVFVDANESLAKIFERLEKPGDWNRYEVRCAGAHIQIVLNGEKTVDYIEPDPAIPPSGLIGLFANLRARVAARV